MDEIFYSVHKLKIMYHYLTLVTTTFIFELVGTGWQLMYNDMENPFLVSELHLELSEPR